MVFIGNRMHSLLGIAVSILIFSGLFRSEKITFCPKNEKCDDESVTPITLQKNNLDDEYKLLKEGQRPIMIWWYADVFPHQNSLQTHEIKCSLGQCLTSINRTLQNDDSTRAFLFYGTSFLANDLPLPRKKYHHWALFHEESPKNNWIFSHEDAIKLFNHTATFRRESHYPLSSQFIVDVNDWSNKKYFVPTQEKNRLQKTEGLAPVVYIQRDCEPPSDRDSYIRELMKYIQIDSYGSCLNNKAMPSDIEGFHMFQEEIFYKFLSRYKFHLSFENAICQDYMTEKLFRPLEIGVVPVYRGSPNASDFMPTSKSLILVDDFENPKVLAEYLIKLNEDDQEYETYLDHFKTGVTNQALKSHIENRKWAVKHEWDKVNFGHRMYAGWECHVCDQIHKWNRAIENHVKDPAHALPRPQFGEVSHMGCPEPKSYPLNSMPVNRSINYWEGFHEASALRKMLMEDEVDSKNFSRTYLSFLTDKYPV